MLFVCMAAMWQETETACRLIYTLLQTADITGMKKSLYLCTNVYEPFPL